VKAVAMNITFREKNADDAALITEWATNNWGGEPLVIRGQKYYPSQLEGILAFQGKEIVAYLIFEIQDRVCEIVVFEVFKKLQGIGTLTLDELKKIVGSKGCNKMHLMTTNDNLDALRFYQRRGFHICGIHVDSVKISRALKPTIGEFGDHGIPVRDEIDLEISLAP
jgi:ribosomal protein S18 acetylase RimI-like enzyme